MSKAKAKAGVKRQAIPNDAEERGGTSDLLASERSTSNTVDVNLQSHEDGDAIVTEVRERKFKGSTKALAFAPVVGVGIALVAQVLGGAFYVALVVAVVTFILTIVDDFVDEKDVLTQLMDGIVTPWLKTAIASYAATAAVGIFADRAGATAGEATVWAAGTAVTVAVALIFILGVVGPRWAARSSDDQ